MNERSESIAERRFLRAWETYSPYCHWTNSIVLRLMARSKIRPFSLVGLVLALNVLAAMLTVEGIVGRTFGTLFGLGSEEPTSGEESSAKFAPAISGESFPEPIHARE